MADNDTFIGEIEFVADDHPDRDFGNLFDLPNLAFIRDLAGEYADRLELMPYQIVGDQVRLLISVYLQPKGAKGRVIAVMVRDPFPMNLQALLQIVEEAIDRTTNLDKISTKFSANSIQRASATLAALRDHLLHLDDPISQLE